MEATCKRALQEEQDIAAQVQAAGNVTRSITANALSQLGDATTPRDLDVETTTVQEGVSPKNLNDVDEWQLDQPTRERHEAQIAAVQAMESEAADSASASDSKTPTSRPKGHKAKQTALERIPEDPTTSEAGSYRSADEERPADE
eukprot:3973218-Amphidinium_carterae.1